MADKDSHFTRRSLLGVGSLSVVAAGLAQVKSLVAFVAPGKQGLEQATADSFAPFTGSTFLFLPPAAERGFSSATVALKLRTVSRHEKIARVEASIPAVRGMRQRESFALLFELEGREPLSPGFHEFAHGEFKGCPLFLSPVGATEENRPLQYEAVFG